MEMIDANMDKDSTTANVSPNGTAIDSYISRLDNVNNAQGYI